VRRSPRLLFAVARPSLSRGSCKRSNPKIIFPSTIAFAIQICDSELSQQNIYEFLYYFYEVSFSHIWNRQMWRKNRYPTYFRQMLERKKWGTGTVHPQNVRFQNVRFQGWKKPVFL
jgi:hypothetical protein